MASKVSQWLNSFTSPKNAKWLFDNLEAMDHLFNEMLKLIEEDGDSFAKKAEMYYQRRPELISHVKEFYRMYRALALRYDHVTGDLAKNILTDLIQSQGSGNWPETGIEGDSVSLPSSPGRISEYKVNYYRPYWRAAGFDFFLGSGRSSDHSRKGLDESSSESGSEYDYSKVIDGYENSRLEARIVSLENELRETKDELQEYKKGSKDQFEHLLNGEILDLSSTKSSLEIKTLQEAMEADAMQFEIEISHRDHIIQEYKAWIGAILSKSMQDKSLTEAESNSEDEQFADEKIKIFEQEQMIRELKAMASHSSNMLLREKSALEAKLSSLMVSTDSYVAKIQILDRQVKQLEAEKGAVCSKSERRITELNQSLDEFKLKVVKLTSEKDELKVLEAKLDEDIKAREGDYSKLDGYLKELNMEHEKLVDELDDARKSSIDLTNRVKELEHEVDRQRALIMDGAEEKREAIRQLCFSIEHYRVGYQQLWKKLRVQNRRPAMVMAT